MSLNSDKGKNILKDAGAEGFRPAEPFSDILRTTYPQLSAGRQLHFNPSLVVLAFIVLTAFYFTRFVPFLFMAILGFCVCSLLIYVPRFFTNFTSTSADLALAEDDVLPIYSILIPLYREAIMLPQIHEALMRIDYPLERLDIQILLEQDDIETQAAAEHIDWASCIRITIVPDGFPRTKPRACNYGLRLARGKYLVIYDAEDRPGSDQLREAVSRFAALSDDVVCLQAPLEITPPISTSGILTRWMQLNFALEYRILFNVLFPTMVHYRLPMPLSGTSNHFRIDDLRYLLGWDSYNLTEDADLGVRIVRRNMYAQMLRTPTYENPPHRWGIWYLQRVRWMSGHIQTWCVHMREPVTLMREIGVRGALLFTAISASRILSGPAHFAVVVLLIVSPAYLTHFLGMHYISIFSLVVYSFWFGLAFSATSGRERRRLIVPILTLPFYWLCLALPAVHAMLQVTLRRFYWYKSTHTPYHEPQAKNVERVKGIEPSS